MIRSIVNIIFVLLILFNSKVSTASIKNQIIVIVENRIISSYELKNKIKTVLFLNGQELSQKNIDNTKAFAINSLINNKLKELELMKYKIEIDERNLVNKLNQISSNDIVNFKKRFRENNLDYDLYLKDLKTELRWQKMIYLIYNKKVEIDDRQIAEELKEVLKEEQQVEEINLSEIEILIDNKVTNQDKISDLFKEIEKIGFEKAASKYSISSSSSNGGNLGWINSKALSKKNFQILNNLKVGEVSKPVKNINSLIIYKILDKRIIKAKNLETEKIKKNIISMKKNELFNLYSNSHLSKVKNTSSITYK